jgi:hypothetical protein
VSALLFAALLSSCSTLKIPPSPSPTLHEAIPAPGSFHLTSDPSRAPRALSLRYVDEGGNPSGVSDEFLAGAVVVVDRSLLPGAQAVQVNGQVCDGRFAIVTGIETDLVLVVTDAGCRVVTTGSHAEGELQHADEAAAVSAKVPVGSRLGVRPLDPNLMVAPMVVPSDESGFVHVDSLPAGRYEVTLIVDEQVRTAIEVELRPGEERFLDLSAALSSAPPPGAPSSP